MFRLGGFVVILITAILQVSSTPPQVAPPEIWLKEYLAGSGRMIDIGKESEPIFRYFESGELGSVTKNGSDYFVSGRNVLSIVFACQAKYPIQWKFPYPEHFSNIPQHSLFEVQNFRTSNFDVANGTEAGPINLIFRSYLIIGSYDFEMVVLRRPRAHRISYVSGRISCESTSLKETQQQQQQSNVHLIWTDGAPTFEIQADQNNTSLFVPPPESNPTKEFVLPCRPTLLNITINLDKKIQDKWTPVELTKEVRFDPRLGFIFTNWSSVPSILGTYRCRATTDPGDVNPVFITVSSSAATAGSEGNRVSKFQRHASLQEGAGEIDVRVTPEKVTCCSTRGSSRAGAPILFTEGCNSPLECQLVKQNLERIERSNIREEIKHSKPTPTSSDPPQNNCSRSNTPPGTGSVIVHCDDGPVVKFREEYVTLLRKSNGNGAHLLTTFERERGDGVLQQPAYITTGKVSPTTEPFEMAEMRRKVRREKYLDTFHFPPPSNIHSRVYPYGGDDFLMTHLNPKNYTTWLFTEELSNKLYEGEVISVACIYPRFSYAHGGYLGLTWRNGTRTVLRVENSSKKNLIMQFPSGKVTVGQEKQLHVIYSKPMTASLEMKFIDCYTPVWNSEQWDKTTVGISVLPAVPPKLAGPMEQTVHFDRYDVNRTITCEASQGTPVIGGIEITKDGMLLDNMVGIQVNVSSSSSDANRKLGSRLPLAITVRFARVSDEMGGMYLCKLENSKGVAMKRIHVIVSRENKK